MSNEQDATASLDTLIAELRKKANATTPGPWKSQEDAHDTLIGNESYRICKILESGHGFSKQNASDASFIAAARTLVPALLDALELARAQRNEALVYDLPLGFDPRDIFAKHDAHLAAALRGEGKP